MTLDNGRKKPGIDEKWQIYQETAAPGAQVGASRRFKGCKYEKIGVLL
jgi:hypothetical protein